MKSKTMKRLILIFSIISAGLGLFAQQSPLYTQYMDNPFVINPAIPGTYNFYQMRLNSRLQWIGFDGAPVTNSLSFFGPFSSKSKDMGIGGTFFQDITGPTSRLGLRAAYAYNIAINSITRVSFGAAIGALQYKYDGTKSNLNDYHYNDPAAPNAVWNKYLPDGMAGIMVYSTKFYAGISADNLFNGHVAPDESVPLLGNLQRHFYVLGSYTEIFNRKWSGEASMVFKIVSQVAQI